MRAWLGTKRWPARRSSCVAFFCLTIPFVQADTIYLSTANLNTIDRFDSSGNGSVFATASSGLNWPLGLAFDHNGNLYVANTFNIEEFNSSGTGWVFATSASGLSDPSSLAFDSGGNLYVANYNSTILKFNANGEASVFATASSGLDYPGGLAFDNSGNLYVTSHFTASIVEFDSDGVGSVFASGLGNAVNIAVEQIPEPATLPLTALGLITLWACPKRRRA